MTKIIKAKPTSPGRRFYIYVSRKHLSTTQPYKPLLNANSKSGGRNSSGRITVRHQGGGHKRRFREIDTRRIRDNIVARVEKIEHDPNRTCYIALIVYKDGKRSYILAPQDLMVGQEVISGSNVGIRNGNCLPLNSIPVGTIIFAIELSPGKGAQLARSAGAYAQIIAREADYVTIKLRSGEMRKILSECRATIGIASNISHNLTSYGKAGRKRWHGIKSTVRGVAMNPVDHPHGGGEGRTSGGRHPVTPWGIPTKGYKTRSKFTNRLIIQRRK